MIYFVEVPNGHIKIGRTGGLASAKNMQQRLGALRIEFKRDDLRAVFFLSERPDISERTLLARMREHRIEGEWHARRPALQLIDELRAGEPLVDHDHPVNQRTVQVVFSGSQIESVAAAANGRPVSEWLRELARAECRRAERGRAPKRRTVQRQIDR